MQKSDVIQSSGSNPFFSGHDDAYDKAKRLSPVLIRFFLIAGLSFLSWLATYSGLTELISANGSDAGSNFKIAIGFAVALLTFMIIYLLDNLFSPINWWLRLLYIGGYVFLTLISVGFGFGFYWNFLESRSETTRSAVDALKQVEATLSKGRIQLEQLQLTFDGLMAISAQNAEWERTVGKTCPNSPPGDGPRRRLREADGKNFKFASEFVRRRSGFLQNDLSRLNANIAKVQSQAKTLASVKPSMRRALFKDINKNLNQTYTQYNAFRSDPQLMQFRDSFSKRAQQVRFDNGKGGTFYCPDAQLKIALLGAVRSINELPELKQTRIQSVEGAEAIIEAFRRLTVSAFHLASFNIADNIRGDLTDKPQGLSERDYIPLLVALFVDLCILLISINRPVNRLQGFLNTARKAHNTQMHEVLRRFHEVHDRRRSARLDVFHDVMFDIGPDQYVAVPIDLRARPDSWEDERDFIEHKGRLTQARYLATLMVTLEEAGLVSRSHFISEWRARRKLRQLKSPYASSPGFRVYKFGKGAWPAIIMDDILGESRKLEVQQKLLPPPLPPVDLEKPEALPNYEESFNAANENQPDESLTESDGSVLGNQAAVNEVVKKKNEPKLIYSTLGDKVEAAPDIYKSNHDLEKEVKKILSSEIKFHEQHHNEEEVSPEIEIDKIARQFSPTLPSGRDEKLE